jgi:EAL domain-containing protein (putative c-di-GMP-specific phosphodiesterase class I)
VVLVKILYFVGLRTIAEFFQTPETMDELPDVGVDYTQGYDIKMPKPVARN